MGVYCDKVSLQNESDVEQKFIYPLLNNTEPLGLGYSDVDIHTKKHLKAVRIGKTNAKSYYPDYLITLRGIPIIVIEAKAPNVDIDSAYSEARLYANEVNSTFQHNINPCQYVIATNGEITYFGNYDFGSPKLEINFDDFVSQNVKFEELRSTISKSVLSKKIENLYSKNTKDSHFMNPISLFAGTKVENSELEENSYGRTLVMENRAIFDPKTEEDKLLIVENAYIKSPKREQHVDPFYKEIKRYQSHTNVYSTLVGTDKPYELVDKIERNIDNHNSAYSLMLIIGNVGSGKSTFVRYFKHIILENKYPDLYNQSEWLFVDLNPAPINSDQIYKWIIELLIKCIENQVHVEFDDLDVIKNLFKSEIKSFEKGIGKLLKSNENQYNEKLFDILQNNISDRTKYLKAIFKYLISTLHKIPIIILDNCDKRDRDEQLLMFEVASWLRAEYNCVVIMPMRDTTYDLYKDEPPLDTVVKDLVFRIDPPNLLNVLQARIDFLIRDESKRKQEYSVGKGMDVVIKPNEQFEYVKAILMAIRDTPLAKRIMFSLSNRSIRKGLEIFVDFCKSGHVDSAEFLKLRALDIRDYKIPTYKLLNALIRKNRKYYKDTSSNFTNMFYSDRNDELPDPFIRLDIVNWLNDNRTVLTAAGFKGYHQVRTVMNVMSLIGHNEEIIWREIKQLLRRGLLTSETKFDVISSDDLVSLTFSGRLHLDMLKNISYLSACSENVLYRDNKILRCVSSRLNQESHLSKLNQVLNAQDLINYLERYRELFFANSSIYLTEEAAVNYYDLENCSKSINEYIESDYKLYELYISIVEYKVGTHVKCIIKSKNHKSILCIIDEKYKAFLATTESKYNLSQDIYNTLELEQEVIGEVLEYDTSHSSFQLKYITHHDVELKDDISNELS